MSRTYKITSSCPAGVGSYFKYISTIASLQSVVILHNDLSPDFVDSMADMKIGDKIEDGKYSVQRLE